jgi:hypothetical protein
LDSNTRYTYENSGFNGFLNRGLSAKPAVTLRSLSQSVARKEINFDQMQTSGNLGDKIQVGGIRLDGVNRRIVIVDELDVEVGWIGNIGD